MSCRAPRVSVPTIDHKVRQGETLSSIAAQFDTTPSELCSINRLNMRMIFADQVIRVPDPEVRAAQVAAALAAKAKEKEEQEQAAAHALASSPRTGPGLATRVTASPSTVSSQGAEETPESVHERQFVKSDRAKLITWGEGVVSGVLIVTPRSLMFDPAYSDPLVAERGHGYFQVHVDLVQIVSVSVYKDPRAMRLLAPPDANTDGLDSDVPSETDMLLDPAEPHTDPDSPTPGRGQDGASPDMPGPDQPQETEKRPQETEKRPQETEKRPQETEDRPQETKERPQETDRPQKTEHRPQETVDRPQETKDRTQDTKERPQETVERPQETEAQRGPEEKTETPKEEPPKEEEEEEEAEEGPEQGEEAEETPPHSDVGDAGLSPSLPSEVAPDSCAGFLPRRSTHYDNAPVYMCIRHRPAPDRPPRAGLSPTTRPPPAERLPDNGQNWFSIPPENARELKAFLRLSGVSDRPLEQRLSAGSDPGSGADALSSLGALVSGPDGADADAFFVVHEEHYASSPAAEAAPEEGDRRQERLRMIRQESLDWELVSRAEVAAASLRQETLEEELPLPTLIGRTLMLDEGRLRDLMRNLPSRAEGCINMRLSYSTAEHGFSLASLYRRCKRDVEDRPCVLLVKNQGAADDTCFGAILSHAMHISDHYYGNGETKLVRWTPEFEIFDWTGENNYILKGGCRTFMVGSSSGRVALWLDEGLYRGRSQVCDTFHMREPLSPGGVEDFTIENLEVWTFN